MLKMTSSPGQISVSLAVIETEGVRFSKTVVCISLLSTGLEVVHSSVLVSSTLTMSPSFRELVVKTLEFPAPVALELLTFH